MYRIVGKPNCPQCVQVKSMFDSKGVSYNYQEIGTDITREEVLESAPGVRSVPIIFKDAEYIGGVKEAQQICGGG